MTQRDETGARARPLSQCPPEIQAVARDESRGDPARLRAGDRLMAYVEASNTTETWEVVEAGPTPERVMARLLDVVPELGGV